MTHAKYNSLIFYRPHLLKKGFITPCPAARIVRGSLDLTPYSLFEHGFQFFQVGSMVGVRRRHTYSRDNMLTSLWWPSQAFRCDIGNFQTRVDTRFAPSQWETALLCNDVSHWLGASLESALPTDTWRENDVFIMSKRRRIDVMKTFYCVACPLGCT